MPGRIEGQVAVITGGANGIGRATALRFLAEGARVVIADMNDATAAETVDLAGAAGHKERIRYRRTDVSQEADVEAVVKLAVDEFGRLDCIFNNAGVGGAFGPITHTSVEDWDYTFAVLVRGVFLGMKHAARVMRKQGSGSIISTASVAGLSGGDGPQAYSAAKAAVINLTRAVAIELAADRVRVNCICPGGILTPLVHRGSAEAFRPMLEKLQPWPEAGLPEHIAGAALFLASDDAHFVTGEALVVDGGLTAAGSRSVHNVSEARGMRSIAGVDRGSTGEELTARTVEEG
jgi:NAD(P)-dependent dehydrogenase (short-subunit alcohol dehydrogenase family)